MRTPKATPKRVTRVVSVVALASLMALSAVGCGDDDDADDTTVPATTAAVTTTEDTEEPAATTEPTTTVAADEIDVSVFEGPWEATSYAITSQADPSVTFDVIAAGAELTAVADTDGTLIGQVEVPEALGGPLTLDFAATLTLVDQETMTVMFDPEIPPLLTDMTGPFVYDEPMVTLTDEDTVFDFGDGAGEVPVTALVVLARAPEGMGLTISVAEPPGEDGLFTASGMAVDEGVVCSAGQTMTVSVTDDEGQPPPWTPEPENLLVEMQFACEDGSGQFTMLIAQPAYSDDDTAAIEAGELMGEGEETWEILSGTDDYTTLGGEGTRTWRQVEPDLIDTVYEGQVTN